MAAKRKRPTLDLPGLLPSWELALRAERKSAQTIKSYGDGLRGFIRWCEDNGQTPALDRDLVKGYVADLLDGGTEPATARARELAMRRFSAWLAEEGELDTDPLLGLKAPKLDAKVTESLTDDELRRLLKVCSGKDFRDRRDEAIIRLMAETGMRAGEVLGLTVADVDLVRGLVTVRRGKGGKGRVAPFGAQTGRAVDRYLRQRRTHRLADTTALWLGDRGKELAYFGLRNTLQYRAELAGIKNFHLHLLRHTAATRWLRAGGSEGGLMAVAGWSTRDMIDRYTGASASERADDLAHRLHTELVKSTGRLADPTDMPFDETPLDKPEKLAKAIDELLQRKPHPASRRPSGDVGQGATPSPPNVDLAAILRNAR